MVIRKADVEDTGAVVALIQKRMDWMDENNLCQWNKTGYLSVYPHSYFEKIIREGKVYVASEQGTVIGAVALFSCDPGWDEEADALYIHHLVGDPMAPGVGRRLLRFAEDCGRARSVRALRLDSAENNETLGNYYASLGFDAVGGYIIDGPYIGIKREKRLDKERL